MTKQKLGPNQRKWLKALESGKFKQTRIGALKAVSGGHCCLGIACELFKPKKIVPTVSSFSNRKIIFGEDTNNAPSFVLSALGLRSYDGAPNGDGFTLTEMNDAGRRFKSIAALIRKDPSVYFKRTK